MSAHKYMADIKAVLNQYLEQLSQATTLWVGFSGGLDSTVLLHALAQMPELKLRLKAIHVHHGLSENADAWLEHCQQFCRQLDIPFVAEKVELRHLKDGIEQAARTARYNAYKKHTQQGDCLLQAHHGDDQIETFMMRATRGAGLQGLAGIPQQRKFSDQVTILRPLLAVPRSVLEDYAAQQQLTWVEDESNQESTYERNWWRNELLPKIWQKFPQRHEVMLRSIQQLQKDVAVFDQLLQPIVNTCLAPWNWPNCAATALCLDALLAQPQALQGYIVRAWLDQHGYMSPSQAWLNELLTVFVTSVEDAQPQLVIGSSLVLKHQRSIYLYTAPELQEAMEIVIPNTVQSEWCGGQLTCLPHEGGVVAGEYLLAPAGHYYTQKIKQKNRPNKTLKAIFQEHKVPIPLRAYWPVIINESQVCSVVNLAIDEQFLAINHSSQQGYVLSWQIKSYNL